MDYVFMECNITKDFHLKDTSLCLKTLSFKGQPMTLSNSKALLTQTKTVI